MNADARFAETCAWLDMLYSDCNEEDGEIIVVESSRRQMLGRYTVGDGECLVLAAKDMHTHPGCYAKINLMDGDKIAARSSHAVGAAKEVKTVVSLHLDVDAGKDARYLSRHLAKLAVNSMPAPPTLIINSAANDGGFHVYWKLKEPFRIETEADRKHVQAKSKAWLAELNRLCMGKLDNTSNIDRVLRCVGVPRLDGHVPYLEEVDFSNTYSLEELTV